MNHGAYLNRLRWQADAPVHILAIDVARRVAVVVQRVLDQVNLDRPRAFVWSSFAWHGPVQPKYEFVGVQPDVPKVRLLREQRTQQGD